MVTRTGEVYLAAGSTLYRWRGRGVERVVTLPAPVAIVDPVEDGDCYVGATVQREIFAVMPDRPEDQRAVRLFFRSNFMPRLNATGRYMSISSTSGDTTVFD